MPDSSDDALRRDKTAGAGTLEGAEQAAFRAEVRAFLQANARLKQDLSPWAVTFERDPVRLKAHFDRGRAWQATLAAHGLAGLRYPAEYGGRGGHAWHERIFGEEAAAYDAGSGFIASTISMLGPTLLRHGTPEQKSHYLPRLLSGEYAFCQLFSEPGAGSDLAGLACRADRDGDEFVVNGQKVWNSAAQFCNWGMLLVRTDPDAPKHRGITFLLADLGRPGIEARPLVQATGAAEFNEVFLTDFRVPVTNVLGSVNEGWTPARTVLSNEASFIGGGAGTGGRYRKLVTLAERFGRRDDPSIRQDLAQYYTRERLLKMLGDRTRDLARSGGAQLDPAMLKLFVAHNRVLTGNIAMAIAGAAGAAGDDEVTNWIQAELLSRYQISIGGGTNEVQRNNLAERALGLPKELRTDHQVAWKDVPRS